ncbi:MAG: hypothetical protein ACLFOY_12200 [Desulfatibacillaceae bacterium]
MANKEKNREGLMRSVFVAHFIIILHIAIIFGVGLAIFFFSGLIHYMPWILIGGSALILGSGYGVFRHLRKNRMSLREVLSDPVFSGRSVEVRFLGGLAALRLGRPGGEETVEISGTPVYTERVLEDPEAVRVRELTELARLFERNLITLDEYREAKKGILKV